MNTKYVIEDTTLTNIADAIRSKTNETQKINTLDFTNKIASIDLSTEEYMVLFDFFTNQTIPTYDSSEVDTVNRYITFYGGELNG